MGDDNDDDESLFRRKMRDVKRIHTKKHDLEREKDHSGTSETYIHQEDEPEELPYWSSEMVEPVTSEEMISFSQSGISEKLMRRLKRGKIPIQSRLDLHGETSSEAERDLIRFIQREQRSHQTCVLIIHGKGRRTGDPKLKNRVNNWLRQCEQVLAFASAQQSDGGAGATYVLLKRLS